MEATTCVVLCLLIVAWATVKVSGLYFRHKSCRNIFGEMKKIEEETD